MLNVSASRRLFYLLLFVLALYLFMTRAHYVIRRAYPFPYRQIILTEARHNNLEPLLVVAVIYVESSFDAGALSAKGARGLMQVMPETGAWVAEQHPGLGDFTVEQLFIPRTNVAIGTWYLQNLLRQFDGNIYLALAAYNSGPNQVRLWLQEGIWDGRRKTLQNIPFPETRFFVRKVERTYQRYKWIYKDLDASQAENGG